MQQQAEAGGHHSPFFLAVHDLEMPRWHDIAVNEPPSPLFASGTTCGTLRITQNKDYSQSTDSNCD